MAEIPVQRKARRNIWPLILLLLALVAALAWYFMSRGADDTPDGTPTAAPTTTGSIAPARMNLDARFAVAMPASLPRSLSHTEA